MTTFNVIYRQIKVLAFLSITDVVGAYNNIIIPGFESLLANKAFVDIHYGVRQFKGMTINKFIFIYFFFL